MYLEHFGLREFPFRLTPDTDFLYMSRAHARAKAYMDYTVWNREGFVVITGEIGCGKTTLIQKLLSEIEGDNVLVAKVFQTQLDEVEFLQAVLVEFGLNPFHAKKVELIDMLNSFLVEQFVQHKQLVLIVDDAHHLGTKVLEEIRMLSGLETRKEKVLHIILVGQPQLNDVLESPDMEQLMQRVRLRFHIKPLGEGELAEYLVHRLRIAGAADPGIFAPDTIPLIHRFTGGVPRLVNTLCDTALMCAYADNLPRVTTAVVNDAVEEMQWQPYAKRVQPKAARERGARVADVAALSPAAGAVQQQLVQRLKQIDTLAPTLGVIADRMANIERLLKTIADGLATAKSDPARLLPDKKQVGREK
jgi:type II secretory pathway predicted ATPase ExeA